MSALQDYHTVKEAAAELGISYKALLMRMRRGQVKYHKLGAWQKLIPHGELARLQSEKK